MTQHKVTMVDRNGDVFLTIPTSSRSLVLAPAKPTFRTDPLRKAALARVDAWLKQPRGGELPPLRCMTAVTVDV